MLSTRLLELLLTERRAADHERGRTFMSLPKPDRSHSIATAQLMEAQSQRPPRLSLGRSVVRPLHHADRQHELGRRDVVAAQHLTSRHIPRRGHPCRDKGPNSLGTSQIPSELRGWFRERGLSPPLATPPSIRPVASSG